MTEEHIRNGMPPVHPGEILADELEEIGQTGEQLAVALAVDVDTIKAILACQDRVTAELALRLSRFFSSGPQLWLNLQNTYDLRVTEIEFGDAIAKQVIPLETP